MTEIYVAGALALGTILVVALWGRRLDLMIRGCSHSAEVLDEAYATREGEIVVSWVCDRCGATRRSRLWREDPL